MQQETVTTDVVSGLHPTPPALTREIHFKKKKNFNIKSMRQLKTNCFIYLFVCLLIDLWGVGVAQLILNCNFNFPLGWIRYNVMTERRIRDRKVVSSNPGRAGGWIFFSRVNFLCWLLFGVHSNHVLPQWHVKDPGHSAKSADGRLHLNTHAPLTQRSRSRLTMPLPRHSVETYQGTQRTRNSSGSTRPQSCHLAEPPKAYPALKRRTGSILSTL